MTKKTLSLILAAALFSVLLPLQQADARRHSKQYNPNGRLVTRRKAEAQWAREYMRRENRYDSLYGTSRYSGYTNSFNTYNSYNDYSSTVNTYNSYTNYGSSASSRYSSPSYYSGYSSGSGYTSNPYEKNCVIRAPYKSNLADRVQIAKDQIQKANIADDKKYYVSRLRRDLDSEDSMIKQKAVADWNNFRQRRDAFAEE